MKKLGMVLAGWLLAIGLAFAQVNINTAGKEELDGLKGIGPSKAQAIVDYRRKNGPFKSVDDLQNVPGIGPATLKDLRAEITVAGSSRAATAKPVTPAPASAAPARPAMPGKAVSKEPVKEPAPASPVALPAAVAKPAAPAAPARPAMPAKPAADMKPAAPAAPVLKPATPAIKPATPDMKAAVPAKPAAPARPAQPAAVN